MQHSIKQGIPNLVNLLTKALSANKLSICETQKKRIYSAESIQRANNCRTTSGAISRKGVITNSRSSISGCGSTS